MPIELAMASLLAKIFVSKLAVAVSPNREFQAMSQMLAMPTSFNACAYLKIGNNFARVRAKALSWHGS